MPRLDRLPQINRNNLLTFPARVNDTAPFESETGPECARWRKTASPRPRSAWRASTRRR